MEFLAKAALFLFGQIDYLTLQAPALFHFGK
jgi:hypothetical protein